MFTSLEALFQDVHYLFLDELSCVSAEQLCIIDQRLRQVKHAAKDHMFGHISIIAFGDFAQLPPFSGHSLIESMLTMSGVDGKKSSKKATKETLAAMTSRADPENPMVVGGRLFRSFTRFTLTQQMRARGCVYQGAITDAMRSGTFRFDGDFPERVREQALSRRDVEADATVADFRQHWRNATLLVEGNQERVQANWVMAQQFAQRTNQIWITWDKDVADIVNSTYWVDLTDEQRQHIRDTNPAFVELFVRGGKCQIIENVKPEMAVANGTLAEFHSLVLPSSQERDPQEVARVKREIATAAPGTRVHLPWPPKYVTVRIPKQNKSNVKWPAQYDMLVDCDDYAVIPLGRVTRVERQVVVPDPDEDIESGIVQTDPFRVEPAFALTIPKSQGLTLPRCVRCWFCFKYLYFIVCALYLDVTACASVCMLVDTFECRRSFNSTTSRIRVSPTSMAWLHSRAPRALPIFALCQCGMATIWSGCNA